MLFSDENGNIMSEPPKVSLLDHGFLFGDSIYEVTRLYERKLFAWQEHWGRLSESARRIDIQVEPLRSEIESRMHSLIQKFGENNAAVRLIITRGEGKLNIDPRTCEKSLIRMAIWKHSHEDAPSELRLIISQIRRNSIHALDPAIKSGNYLNNVLAFKEAVDLGYDDSILLNPDAKVSELTTSNIAWIKDGVVHSPATDSGILHGITRKILMSIEDVNEGQFDAGALENADEVFSLSTLKEVVPVTEIRFEDGYPRKYAIGPKTLELKEKFRKAVVERIQEEDSIF